MYLYPHGVLSTWTQRIIGSHSVPELPTASVCPSGFLPPTFASFYIRPCHISTLHNSKHIAETYRLLLCVFVDSSRAKLVFIAICALFSPCCEDGVEGKRRERGTETYDEKSPGFGFQKVRRAKKSGCAMLLRRYDIFTGSPDVRHDLYHTPYTLLLERICYLRTYLYQQYRYNILSSRYSARYWTL